MTPTIDGFTDFTPIGQGASGSVYRAREVALNRDVAIKVLNPVTHSASDRERFRRELRALGELSGHPNIVTIYSHGLTAAGKPYLIMDLMGDALNAVIPLDQDRAIEIVSSIGRGLEAAHQTGILHRDIKPANIFVDRYGEARVGDFGLVGVTDAYTLTTASVGSPAYMAPELFEEQAASVRSDVYALAATFYEMVENRLPFTVASGGLHSLFHKVLTEPPEPATNMSPAVEDVVRKAMAKDPDERHQSAMELVHDLANAHNNPEPTRHRLATAPSDDTPTTTTTASPNEDQILVLETPTSIIPMNGPLEGITFPKEPVPGVPGGTQPPPPTNGESDDRSNGGSDKRRGKRRKGRIVVKILVAAFVLNALATAGRSSQEQAQRPIIDTQGFTVPTVPTLDPAVFGDEQASTPTPAPDNDEPASGDDEPVPDNDEPASDDDEPVPDDDEPASDDDDPVSGDGEWVFFDVTQSIVATIPGTWNLVEDMPDRDGSMRLEITGINPAAHAAFALSPAGVDPDPLAPIPDDCVLDGDPKPTEVSGLDSMQQDFVCPEREQAGARLTGTYPDGFTLVATIQRADDDIGQELEDMIFTELWISNGLGGVPHPSLFVDPELVVDDLGAFQTAVPSGWTVDTTPTDGASNIVAETGLSYLVIFEDTAPVNFEHDLRLWFETMRPLDSCSADSLTVKDVPSSNVAWDELVGAVTICDNQVIAVFLGVQGDTQLMMGISSPDDIVADGVEQLILEQTHVF